MTAEAPTLGALFAKVRAAPCDDAPRLALAEELTRRGDLRGEFIALQLRARAGLASRKDAAREKALLKANARAWAGELGALLADKAYRYDRGFLSECRLKAPTGEQLRALAASDAWATVESLSLAAWSSPRKLPAYGESVEVAGEVLTSDLVPALRSVSVHSAAVLMKMVRSPRPLSVEAIECSGWFHLYCWGFELKAADLEAIGATRSLPRLRRLALSTHGLDGSPTVAARGPVGFEALLRGPNFDALEHFGLTDVSHNIPAWLDALSARAAPSKTFEVVLGSGSWLRREGLTLCFSRDDSGRFSKLSVTVHPDAWEHRYWVFGRAERVLSTVDRAVRADASITIAPGRKVDFDGFEAAKRVFAMLGR